MDDDEKADAFIKYWAEKHPHVEVVGRSKNVGFVLINIKLKMEATNGNPTA